MTENVLCALIGVGGTLLGTIVGLAFPYLCSGFGRKLLVISNIDVRFGTGKPDGEGGYDGSWINFRASILNKKNKSLLRKLHANYTAVQTELPYAPVPIKTPLGKAQEPTNMMNFDILMLLQNQALQKTSMYLCVEI